MLENVINIYIFKNYMKMLNSNSGNSRGKMFINLVVTIFVFSLSIYLLIVHNSYINKTFSFQMKKKYTRLNYLNLALYLHGYYS